jgi:hypothetical protein
MLNKKCLGAVILAAAAVSSTAMADDRGVNTAVGAVIGAAIGHNSGGRDGALVGGVIGAALGNAVSTGDNRSYNGGYYDNRGSYYRQAPVYVEARSYAPAYYEPRQVIYTPPVRYYQQPAVVYVNPGRGHYGHHGRDYDRDGRWDRDHDRRDDNGYGYRR